MTVTAGAPTVLPASELDRRGPVAIRVRRVLGAPVVAVRVILAGGARRELTPGLAAVTGRMLSEGTRRRGFRRIAEDLEARGMLLSTFGQFDAHGLALDALASDWEEALEQAAELLYEPAFPEDRCAWVRRQAQAELESLADQPDIRTAWAFSEQLYAPHPRARRLLGDAASLERITPEDCAAFHRQGLARGGVVAVAGVVDAAALARRVEELFPASGAAAAAEAELPPPDGRRPRRQEVRLAGPGDQAHLYAGHLTVPRDHPDFPALELLAVVLGAGSGLSGRIPTRIREQEGLAYSAHAHTVAGAGLDPGRLMAYVGTAPANVARAERGIAEELERLVAEGVGDRELERARAYLLGREPFRRETARQWADLLAEAAFYGLPLDDPEERRRALSALDRTAVDAAARRHVRPGELGVTVGLPEADGGAGEQQAG